MQDNEFTKKEVNEYILRIVGQASLMRALIPEKDYSFTIQASCIGVNYVNNEDGSIDIVYKFRPYSILATDEKGEAIKSKESKRYSQKLRGRIYLHKQEKGIPGEEEEYYTIMMQKIISYFDLVAEFLKNKT